MQAVALEPQSDASAAGMGCPPGKWSQPVMPAVLRMFLLAHLLDPTHGRSLLKFWQTVARLSCQVVLRQESADTSRDIQMLPLRCPRFLMDIGQQRKIWPVFQTVLHS